MWSAVRHKAGEETPAEVAVELRPGESHAGSAGRLGRSVPAAVAVATAAVFFAGGGWAAQADGHNPAGPGKEPAVSSEDDPPTVAPPAVDAPAMMPALQPALQPAQSSDASSKTTSAPPAAPQPTQRSAQQPIQ